MKSTIYAGLLVGLVGATLDVSSGYTLAMAGGKSMTGENSLAFSAGLVALGVAVLAVAIASLLPKMESRAGFVGFGMEVCGVAMVIVSAWSPGMIPLMSFAMLAVGGVMILNGALMQRRRKDMRPTV